IDARANGLEGAIDRFRLVRGGDGLLRVVDLEREVHPPLEVESPPQRDVPTRLVAKDAVGASTPRRDVAGEQQVDRRDAERDDEENAILQGHTNRGWKVGVRNL